MPSIAQIPISSSITSSSPGGKKRKREQLAYGDGEDYAKLSSIQYTSSLPPSRPLFAASPTDNAPIALPAQAPRLVLKPRSLKPSRPHDAKRQRIFVPEREKEDLNVLEPEIYIAPNASAHTSPTVVLHSGVREGYTRTDLSPCHICHQKPKVRTDLDSYGDCEGCGKRTCYICMRECLGPSSPSQLFSDADWGTGELESDEAKDGMSFTTQSLNDDGAKPHGDEEDPSYGVGAARTQDRGQVGWPSGGMEEWGHRGMVCSRCCVERGVDGEVRCLGCLRVEEGE